MQKINVVAYCRYSSDAQRDGYSIEAQRKAIMEYCKRMNYNILEFYIDEAKTGTNDNRDAFQRMIHDSNKGLFKAVIVHKLDRFSRDRYNSVIYRKKLKDSGVKLISVLENIDDDNPEDLILLSVLEGMADYYSKNLAREVRKGMNEAAKQGLSTGGVSPFGYKVDKSIRRLVPNDKAQYVRMMFEMFANGSSTLDIETKLNDLGITTGTGKMWTTKAIRKILENEVYCGVKLWNSYRTNKHPETTNHDNIIRVNDAHEAIVSRELFDKVQYLISSNKKVCQVKYRNPHKYLLTGYLFCKKCGKPISGACSTSKSKKIHYYYKCKGATVKHTTKCSTPAIRQELLESYVIKVIADIFENSGNINKWAKDIIEVYNKKIGVTCDVATLKANLNDLSKRKNRLLDLYLSGDLEKDIYISKLNELENGINTIKCELLKAEDNHTFTIEEIELALKLMIDDLKINNPEINKKGIFNALIDKIAIDNESMDLYLKLPLDWCASTDTYGGPAGTRTPVYNPLCFAFYTFSLF